MEFIDSFISHLVDTGILSTEEQKDDFLSKLLYSEDIEVSDFDQRSITCLQQFFIEVFISPNFEKLENISRKIFENWQRRQNDIIHQKLAKQFHSSNLRAKLSLSHVLQKWKHQIEVKRKDQEIMQLKSQILQLDREVAIEREEKEEYQQKLKQRGTAQVSKPIAQILDASQLSRSSQNDSDTLREDRIQTQSSFQKSRLQNFVQKPDEFINIGQATKHAPYIQSSESDYPVQIQNPTQSGSRTEFDPLNSVTHRQANSMQFGFGSNLGFTNAARQQNQLYYSQIGLNQQSLSNMSKQPKDQHTPLPEQSSHNFHEDSESFPPQQLRIMNRQKHQSHQNIASKFQLFQAQPQQQMAQQLSGQEYYNQTIEEELQNERQRFNEDEQTIREGSKYESELYSQQDTYGTRVKVINQKHTQPCGEDQRLPTDSQDISYMTREEELFNKACDAGDFDLCEGSVVLGNHNQIARSLQKQSQEDRLKLMLEAVIQEKFQGQIPEVLSPTQQRQLEHLVSFVNKINNETNECTFHPSINKNTNKILGVRSPLLSDSSKKVFSRLHKDSEMKQRSHKKYQEIKHINELVECTFSPQTNSPRTELRFSPVNSIQRLHYQEINQRTQNLSRKEAERIEEFRRDHTFKPEREKTKRLDGFFVKSNKENEASEDMYERLYKNHQVKEEKLEMKRRLRAKEEIEATQGRSKSPSKRSKLELSTISNLQQFSSQYPQTCTNQKATQNMRNQFSSPKNHLTSPKNHSLSYSSTINFQQNLKGMRDKSNQSQSKQNMSRSNIANTLSQSTQSLQISKSGSNRFHQLYQNALQSSKRKEKLRKSIDQELGLSFSPKMFKPSSQVAQPSPKTNVIDRNEEFLRNKIMKIQLQEEQKYSDCTFEPQFVSKSISSQTSKIAQSINYHLSKLKASSKGTRQQKINDVSYSREMKVSASFQKPRSQTGSVSNNQTLDEKFGKLQNKRV